MASHVVGRIDDLDEGPCSILELEGRSIGIVRYGGQVYAIRNICPHQQGPLCEGRIFPTHTATVQPDGRVSEYLDHDRPVIACPRHGWEFDLRTGRCLADPARRVAVYPVAVENDEVVVT